MDLAAVLGKHSAVFKDELICIIDEEAKFQIYNSVEQRCVYAKPVPYHLCECELSRLERERESDWACPIVSIVKTNGKICICGNYRATVNTATTTDQYPIARIGDICSMINGGKVFIKNSLL